MQVICKFIKFFPTSFELLLKPLGCNEDFEFNRIIGVLIAPAARITMSEEKNQVSSPIIASTPLIDFPDEFTSNFETLALVLILKKS